jgi:hypothetical protein
VDVETTSVAVAEAEASDVDVERAVLTQELYQAYLRCWSVNTVAETTESTTVTTSRQRA